jgi:biotin-dependent carboxylase-like uncharacterized protein
MNPALRVLSPGLMTTVQDLGRPGLQHLGIPVGGALDPLSLRAANALVANPPNSAALEVLYLGPTLVVEADDVRIAIVGAEAEIALRSEHSKSRWMRKPGNRSMRLRRGDTLRIGSPVGRAVGYLAVEGGFDIKPILRSVSTCMRGGFGGCNGRALAVGDCVPLSQATVNEQREVCLEGLDLRCPKTVRVIAGPQADYFSDDELKAFFKSEYAVSQGSDRMGMRLDGRKIRHACGFNIASDAIAPGSVQIMGNGQPIVLLADRQTTGGYPKIATVISADLPALGRLPVGAPIAFEPVSMADALAARRKHLALLEGIGRMIKPLKHADEEVIHRLNDNNLISGVVAAVA